MAVPWGGPRCIYPSYIYMAEGPVCTYGTAEGAMGVLHREKNWRKRNVRWENVTPEIKMRREPTQWEGKFFAIDHNRALELLTRKTHLEEITIGANGVHWGGERHIGL